MNDFEKLIEEKKASDRKLRKTTFWIVAVSIMIILIIFYLVTRTKKVNSILVNRLDTAQVVQDSLAKKLRDDIIECVGKPTGSKTSNGLPKYNFTIRISDSSIIPTINRVEYYFADDTYDPKLKQSDSAGNNFSVFINNSWGCMETVPVYLYHKNNSVDTILFRMCEKAKLDLPEIK